MPPVPTKTKIPLSIKISGRRRAPDHPETALPEHRGGGGRVPRVSPYIEYKNIHPAMEVALYYGFTPPDSPIMITRKDRDLARELHDDEKTNPFSVAPTLEERIAFLRYYQEKNARDGMQSAMLCSELNSVGVPRRKSSDRLLAFEIIGSGKSIAEATLIQTAFATLKEAQHENLMLHINSVGDRESMNHFARELGNYYRKYAAVLPQSCKSLLRVNPIELLRCRHERCRDLSEDAPRSIGFLGEESRRHFKEVLEFLEELEIPYRIDHTLSGNRAFATETMFEIRETLPEGAPTDALGNNPTGTDWTERRNSRCLCAGVRYNALGKRLGLKHDAPSVGLNLTLPQDGKDTRASRSLRFKRPLVFFLQLGFYAKLKSLRIIEVLRKAHIPIYQALGRDKLMSQVSVAEHLKIPYSIILGQREALENSVIIRNTMTRAQETIKMPNLVEYLRKMKLG